MLMHQAVSMAVLRRKSMRNGEVVGIWEFEAKDGAEIDRFLEESKYLRRYFGVGDPDRSLVAVSPGAYLNDLVGESREGDAIDTAAVEEFVEEMDGGVKSLVEAWVHCSPKTTTLKLVAKKPADGKGPTKQGMGKTQAALKRQLTKFGLPPVRKLASIAGKPARWKMDADLHAALKEALDEE